MINYSESCGCQMNNQMNSNYAGVQSIMNNQVNSNNDKCGCNCTFEFEPKNECESNDDMTREEMAKQLKCYRFAIIELGLYLDTHPDDEKAICLHKEYCNRFKELEDKYQKVYGPLTIMFPCNKWRWLEEPWPWERGNF